jgi:hypothetical protein
VAVRWQNEKLDPADPHPVTGMRLFGRDTGYEFVPVPDEEGSTANLRRIPPPQHLSQAQVTPADENEPPRLGLGAWNDAAPVPAAARSVIREAAGIEIPSASFVVWVLAGYLLVLVPLNWVVFRLIGRIEWAWVAAPLIAIGGTALVVRLAQLDIGFVRSVTDVGVLETQPSHPRGHLTRFSALYTSLSTGYDIEFDDPTGLIQPFSTGDGVPPVGESPHDLEYRRDDKVRLSGFHVLSNRADLVRSEQLIDLGGPIALAPTDGKVDPGVSYTANVENRSKFELLHPIAVRRGAAADTWEVAWLENLRPGLRGAAAFESIPTRELLARWDEKSSITIGVADKILSLRQLLQETLKDKEFRRGDVKLLASIGTALPGLTVKPRSTQPRHLTLLVANLAYATAPIQHDENSRWQVSVKTFTPETSDEPAKGGQP